MNYKLEKEFNILIDKIKTHFSLDNKEVINQGKIVSNDLTPKVLEEFHKLELPYIETAIIHNHKDKDISNKHLEYFNVQKNYYELLNKLANI